VALLRDDGHLRQDADGTWTARPGTETIPVPPGIRALLEARLEGLLEDERRVAQRASVMGRTFEVAALAGMEGVGGTDLNRPLLALVRKELLRPDRAELSAGDAFRFRHVLIRDAAYEALPKAERATLHERFADWLERAAGDRVTELEEILGYHLEQAHRYRAELGESGLHLRALAERAGGRLAAAGNRIMQLGDPGAATVLLERATAILPMDSPLLPEALMDRGSAWSRLGDAERADRGVAEARSLVRDDLPAATRYRVAIDAAHRMSAEPGGERNGELGRVGLEAVTLGESLGDDRLLVRGLSALAYSHALEGHVMAEREILSRSIEIHRAAGRVAALADDIATIANRLPIGPWPVGEALLDIERMLPEVQLSPESHATVLLAQGGIEMLAGSTDRGRARLAEAKAIADEIGVIVPLAAADWPMMLGIAELLVGDAPRAREPLAWAIDVLTAAQDWGHLATVAGLAAQVLIACGDTGPDARARADLARRTSSPNDVDAEVRWRIATAILEDAAGRTSEARALASEACQIVEASEFVLLKIEALLALARVHARDPAGSVAEGARGEALALAERKGADELARRIREREL
jgi:hypothetical protein